MGKESVIGLIHSTGIPIPTPATASTTTPVTGWRAKCGRMAWSATCATTPQENLPSSKKLARPPLRRSSERAAAHCSGATRWAPAGPSDGQIGRHLFVERWRSLGGSRAHADRHWRRAWRHGQQGGLRLRPGRPPDRRTRP